MSCKQKRQLVRFPKVRILKQWFRHFNDHKEFHNEGNLHLFKQRYFERKYYDFMAKVRELTGISLDAFCGETQYDIGLAMCCLNNLYSDLYGFYIYYDGVLKGLDDWIRGTDLSGSFYFGGTLDYHC